MRVRRKMKRSHLKYILKNVCGSILCMAVCVWQTGDFHLAYGSDESGSFDTGGFDMDIGEGTGQLPDNWDSVDSGNESQTDNEEVSGNYEDFGESGNSGENSVQETIEEDNWSMDNNWQDRTRWKEEQTETKSRGGNDNGESMSLDRDADSGNAERGDWSESDNAAEGSFQISGAEGEANSVTTGNNGMDYSVDSDMQTATPGISARPSSVPARKPEKTKTPSPAPEISEKPESSPDTRKQQKLALSYYRTNEKAVSSAATDKNTENEKLPEFLVEIQDSNIRLTIRKKAFITPLQIFSLRINEKEVVWYWEEQKLVAEIPKGISHIKKAELLLSMDSGKLYHETMDLKDEQ